MLQIDETIISLDLFQNYFVCDLPSCKGICCVEGDAGAPLEQNELTKLKEILPYVWNDLSNAAKEVIQKQGVFYIDDDNEPVTSIVDGRECVFTVKDKQGIYKCAIEKAYKEGKIDFYKPISCHLYPVRIKEYTRLTAVNVHRWKVCNCARILGKKLHMPVYKFLKEPLIRKFGEEWYHQVEIFAHEMDDKV